MSVLTAELALIDAKQHEVDTWCAEFVSQKNRPPQHAEKLAGSPSYKALLRLKRLQRRQPSGPSGDGGSPGASSAAAPAAVVMDDLTTMPGGK